MKILVAFSIVLSICFPLSAEEFMGTAGNDRIVIDMGRGFVSINGIESTIADTDSDIRVIGNGGIDRLVFRSAPDTSELVRMEGRTMRVRADSYELLALGFKYLYAIGDDDDFAQMFDSPDDDRLEIGKTTTEMNGQNRRYTTRGFFKTSVYATAGGDDHVDISTTAWRRMVADENSFTLLKRKDAMNHYVTGFDQIRSDKMMDFFIYDEVQFAETLVVRRDLLRWTTENYTLEQQGPFEKLTVVSNTNLIDDQADIMLERAANTRLSRKRVTEANDAGGNGLGNWFTWIDDEVQIRLQGIEDITAEVGRDASKGLAKVVCNEHRFRNITADLDTETVQVKSRWEKVDFIGFDDLLVDAESYNNTIVTAFKGSVLDDHFICDRDRIICENANIKLEFVLGNATRLNIDLSQGGRDSALTMQDGFGLIQMSKERLLMDLSPFNTDREIAFVDLEESINLYTGAPSAQSIGHAWGGQGVKVDVSPDGIAYEWDNQTHQCFGFSNYVVSGGDRRANHVADYGVGPDKMEVVYNNQNDPTLKLTKNFTQRYHYRGKFTSQIKSCCWLYETDTANLFVIGAEQYFISTYLEVNGIEDIEVLNAPANYPVEELDGWDFLDN